MDVGSSKVAGEQRGALGRSIGSISHRSFCWLVLVSGHCGNRNSLGPERMAPPRHIVFCCCMVGLLPAWLLLPVRFSLDSLVGDTSHIPWPWSFICAIVFGAVIAMLFIWLGVAVYSTFHLLAHGNLSLRSVRKGFLWGLVAYGLAQACKLAISIHYPQPPSHAEHWGSLTVLGVIENFGTWSTLLRFPYFIGTATTLWFLESRDKPEQVRAA
jgi:xanthine/uracil permease